jgi:hypothetical protein
MFRKEYLAGKAIEGLAKGASGTLLKHSSDPAITNNRRFRDLISAFGEQMVNSTAH